MPDLEFVLPHWLYWAGLVAFPLIAMALVKRASAKGGTNQTNLGVGYLCLITGGFVGMHRHYLKNVLGFLYLIPFIGILVCNTSGRDARIVLSQVKNDILSYEFEVKHFGKRVADGYDDQDKLTAAQTALETAQKSVTEAQETVVFYNDLAGWLAIAIAVGLLIDAILLPRMVARYRETEPVRADDPPVDDNRIDLSGKPAWYRPIAHLSRLSGEFVAYWCVIAVFVYYYEVLARYVFNSPTNWAHESMFLMFGMQYLICGAHAYLTDSHVRVDVFYARFSRRKKALADIATSFFFFVFAGTLLITGWIFAMDAMRQMSGPSASWEVSFTEWAIQYWPVKLAMVLGALLLVLQGLAKLGEDIAIAVQPDVKEG